MSLHPQAEAYLKLLPTGLTTPSFELTPELIAEMRTMDAFAEQRGPIVPLPLVRDDVATGVPVRIYRPAGRRPRASRDRLLPRWRLGLRRRGPQRRAGPGPGGAQRGGRDLRGLPARPRHPFPAAADDGWSRGQGRLRPPGGLRVDPERIAVYGDSAGGNVAAVAAWQARDAGLRLAHQVLVYPVVDVAMDTESYRTYATGFGLGAGEMAWFIAQYGGDPADPQAGPGPARRQGGPGPGDGDHGRMRPALRRGRGLRRPARGGRGAGRGQAL